MTGGETPAAGCGSRSGDAGHAAPVEPTQEQVTLAILQDAADRAHQRRLTAALDGTDAVDGACFLEVFLVTRVFLIRFRRGTRLGGGMAHREAVHRLVVVVIA